MKPALVTSIVHRCVALLYGITCFSTLQAQGTKINRKALVERHTVINTKVDSLSSLSVGNGKFAFTVDVTGLQSFPDVYAKGVPLGTQSEWGWHSFPNAKNFQFSETLKEYDLNGRKVPYATQIKQPERNKEAVSYFRENPHRLQLGNIGFELLKRDGSIATIADIKNIRQTLNMWLGEIKSHFEIEGESVDVVTFVNQQQDIVAAKVTSKLLVQNRLRIRIHFPYPTNQFSDFGNNFKDDANHQSSLTQPSITSAIIKHQLDTNVYHVGLRWNGQASISEKSRNYFLLKPSAKNYFEFSCGFSSTYKTVGLLKFDIDKAANETAWNTFWTKGAAVDFSGSTDARAKELERRIVLSQYLTKINCGSKYPPQETGLTYNSWYGRPHLEMHWWHGIHFALWGRLDILEQQLTWYKKVANEAKIIAQRQGYDGVRWQKMTDPNGKEAPSSVGAFLIWQQPHVIYYSELVYRQKATSATLNKYKDLVFATADFMASYAYYDSATKRYILGKGVIPAQERFKAEETFNPTYELTYWYWALTTAQQWRERLHLPRVKKWDDVLKHLSPLPVQNGVYLATESATDSYTNPVYKTDHPSVLGALGMVAKTPLLDTVIMHNTFNLVWKDWTWKDTWGWDFPMTAMTATRIGLPDKAIDALLMNITTNTYLPNGHNYQDDRLTIYLPGNGGLLAAIAMMCAGYDGCKIINPGIPKNGKWQVKWEGLYRMP